MKIQLSKSQHNEILFSESVQDLDVTPIMNMFVILIPFLISMAVFTQMSIISFSLPPSAGIGLDKSNGKPKIKMTVVITAEYLAIVHGEKMLDSIPMSGPEIPYTQLLEKVSFYRDSIEIQDEAIVAVRDSVRFQTMVKVMDICRTAGFQKIGVSSATVNAGKGA